MLALPSIPKQEPAREGPDRPEHRRVRRARRTNSARSRSRAALPRGRRQADDGTRAAQREARVRAEAAARVRGAMRRRDKEGRSGQADARRRGEDQGENPAEMLFCTRCQVKRPWYRLEADAQMKWVCVASCPCTIQVGGQQGFFELLAVLKSRNEDQLVKSLEAEVGNAPARGDEPLASTVAPAGEDPGDASAHAQKQGELDEVQRRREEKQRDEAKEMEEKRRERAREEREREREREVEKAREKEKLKEQEKAALAPAQSKAAAPVKDAKPPTNKIREKLEKAHIDFEDL